jgi:hypothetical protein
VVYASVQHREQLEVKFLALPGPSDHLFDFIDSSAKFDHPTRATADLHCTVQQIDSRDEWAG